MNKISIRDKCILLILLLGFAAYVGYNFLWLPVNAQIAELEIQEQDLKGKIGDQTPLEKEITELESENTTLLKSIDEYRESQGRKSLNKEEFLVFLGAQCNQNKVGLIKFNDLGCVEETNNVWKMQLNFELRGDLSNLNKICKAIDDINIKYSIGGMSLRQNDSFAYLTRFFDGNSNLEWYKDETPIPEEHAEEKTGNDVLTIPDTLSPEFNVPADSIQMPQTVINPTTPIPKLVPDPTPIPTPTSTPPPKDENLTERLVELSNYYGKNYGFMFLKNNNDSHDFYSGGVSQSGTMRLNITVQFIMYSDPKVLANSFMAINSGV